MSPRHGKDDGPGLIARLRAQLDQVTAERDKLQRHIEAQAELDAMLMTEALPAVAGDQTGPIARVQGPRTAGHRAPRVPPEQRWLRVVPGFVPAFGALKYAWHGHRIATAITGSVLTAAVATTTAAVVAAPAHSTPHRPGLTASSLGPAWHTTGVPIPSPSASAARPGLDAKSSRKSRLPVVVPVPAPPAPSVTLPPSVPVLPSPSPAAPPLTLSVSSLDLGVYMTGSVQVSNPQQDQAVSWSASCGADAAVIPAQGVLEPGQQDVQLQVQVNPVDGASGGLCVFSPGNERLTVTWAGAGAPSAGI